MRGRSLRVRGPSSTCEWQSPAGKREWGFPRCEWQPGPCSGYPSALAAKIVETVGCSRELMDRYRPVVVDPRPGRARLGRWPGMGVIGSPRAPVPPLEAGDPAIGELRTNGVRNHGQPVERLRGNDSRRLRQDGVVTCSCSVSLGFSGRTRPASTRVARVRPA
jgi:hypothetical protein